jgi:hypothetical protein
MVNDACLGDASGCESFGQTPLSKQPDLDEDCLAFSGPVYSLSSPPALASLLLSFSNDRTFQLVSDCRFILRG